MENSFKSKHIDLIYEAMVRIIRYKYSNGKINKLQYHQLISALNEVFNERLIALMVEHNLNKFYYTLDANLNQAIGAQINQVVTNNNEVVSFSCNSARLRLTNYGS